MHKILPLAIFLAAASVAPARASDKTPASDSVAVVGRTVYERSCASCHGAQAQGAPNWKHRDKNGDLPAPPQNAQGHTWRHSDAMLFDIISKGLRDPFDKTTGLTMPPFGKALSPQQIHAVIAYFKTLWTPEERAFQSQETDDQPAPIPAQ